MSSLDTTATKGEEEAEGRVNGVLEGLGAVNEGGGLIEK